MASSVQQKNVDEPRLEAVKQATHSDVRPQSPGNGSQGTHIRQERPNAPWVLQLSRARSSVLFHCHPLIREEERDKCECACVMVHKLVG